MKSNYFISVLIFFLLLLGWNETSAQNNTPQLLIRLDDSGMNHSVNMATEEMAKTGIPFSTSVMFACPWYQEAVDILKKYPHVSVGIHLTLNSEWRNYRWGPILGRSVVPSLVDSLGYFLPSVAAVIKNSNMDDVEKELSAQIERALNSGLRIDYIDHHMGTAAATPQLRAVFEKLSKKYHLGMARYFGEDVFVLPSKSTSKKDVFINHINNLKSGSLNLVVFHTAKATPEMNAIVSLNQPGQRDSVVAWQRSTSLEVLTSKDFKDLVKQKKFQIITYGEMIKKVGLKDMHPPIGKINEN